MRPVCTKVGRYPHPRCFAERVWILLIPKDLSFLFAPKSLEMHDIPDDPLCFHEFPNSLAQTKNSSPKSLEMHENTGDRLECLESRKVLEEKLKAETPTPRG